MSSINDEQVQEQIEELQEPQNGKVDAIDQEMITEKRRLLKRASLLSFILPPPSPLRRECLSLSDSSSSSPSSPTSQRTSPIKLLRRKSSNFFQESSKSVKRVSMYGLFTGSSNKLQDETSDGDGIFQPLQQPKQNGDNANEKCRVEAEKKDSNKEEDASIYNAQEGAHFRPMRYEVKAELDKFFGQTKSQKKEMTLRTKDEEGHVWYDGIEQEEFAHLIESQVETPSCFSRRSSFASSACQSPTTSRSRHESLFLTGPLVVVSPTRQDAASFQYSPFEWSTSPMQPFAIENNDGITFDVINRRRKRNTREIQKGNCVADDKPMQPDFDKINLEEKSGLHDIQMPAFLPLKRHQLDADLINEAFSNPFESEEAKLTSLLKEKDTTRSLQQHTRRERPADLRLKQHNVIDWDNKVRAISTRRASMICSPNELHLSAHSSAGDDSYLQYLQRRRSSFDSSDLSPFGMRFRLRDSISPSSPNPFQHRRYDSCAKADALLGKNAINEKLLVPGGLSTGLHVYDGVEIPCRSVHLPSDDEDDLEEKALNKSENRQKKSMANIKTWLKAKGGGKKGEE